MAQTGYVHEKTQGQRTMAATSTQVRHNWFGTFWRHLLYAGVLAQPLGRQTCFSARQFGDEGFVG